VTTVLRNLAGGCVRTPGRRELVSLDQGQVRDFARTYTEAWCSHDPARVADHFTLGGTIAINGGAHGDHGGCALVQDRVPGHTEFMDDVLLKEEAVEYHWTFTGTSTSRYRQVPWVQISGFEEWRFGDDGLVAESQGHYDQAEYDQQLEHGATEPQ
jgi:hypothetical protein